MSRQQGWQAAVAAGLMALAGTAQAAYWSLFNIEGESTVSARYVTYGTLDDMLNDTNRLSDTAPNSVGFGRNIVGSGSDGMTYWSLFNIEGESAVSARYVTYGTLDDMLNDTNRLSDTAPNSVGFGRNIVGSGSDGMTYWSLFNIEGESAVSARYVTYGSLGDMLNDTNRLSDTAPNSVGFGRNIVGSGSDEMRITRLTPEPSAFALAALALATLVGLRRRHGPTAV